MAAGHAHAAEVEAAHGQEIFPARMGALSQDKRRGAKHHEAMTSAIAVRHRQAVALVVAVVSGVTLAVAGSLAVGRGWNAALHSFVVSNTVIGASFGLCGFLLAWHLPRNPVGWLLLVAGTAHALSAGIAPVGDYGIYRAHWPSAVDRALATAFVAAWPWGIGLCLPLLLQLFPEGSPLPGRGWRLAAWATVVTSPLFVAEFVLDDRPVQGPVRSIVALPGYRSLQALWTISELRTLTVLVVGLAALVVRYRRGDERLRRQLLWLLLAVFVMVVAVVPWSFVAGTPVYVLFAIPLVPVAMTVAILRHGLLDIRLVVSRAVLYALLSSLVIAAYVGLVALLEEALRQGAKAGSSVLATIVIAVGFNPVRVRLQRQVDRVLYGDRADPVRAVSRVGERLAAGLPGVLEAVREALRMPFAALRASGAEVAASGAASELLHSIPLTYGTARVGDLVVGLRPGEKRLGSADRAVLELLAAPLSVAVYATTLSQELQRSRERLVLAREEERRRLRRDLHDGLGPALTGVTFKADAAGNLIGTDPAAARALLAELRTETAQAISDIRRLVYDLRPPALDELGLVAAIRQTADRLERPGLSVTVTAPASLPALPAAVESAAFRIAAEALTNAVRHSGGRHIGVQVTADGPLRVEVCDDGHQTAESWSAGVGLASMHERAAELGGTCSAGPGPRGGRVVAVLPLQTSRSPEAS